MITSENTIANIEKAKLLKSNKDIDSYRQLLEIADESKWLYKEQVLRFGSMVLAFNEVKNRSEVGDRWHRIGVSSSLVASTVDVQPIFGQNINEELVFVNVYNGQFEKLSDTLAVVSNQREDHLRMLIQYQIPEIS